MRARSFTTFQAASICDVYPSTVICWIKQKKMRAYTTPGGHRRILKPDIIDFLKRYNMPVPNHLISEGNRVLIVEDDPAVGKLLCKALRRASAGLDVQWTQDGIGALLALAKEPPDLLVLDVVLPVVDGASVLSSLRSDPATRSIRVVGITGKRLPPEKLRFMQRHTDAFFHKPFDMNEFVRQVTKLLRVPAEAALP